MRHIHHPMHRFILRVCWGLLLLISSFSAVVWAGTHITIDISQQRLYLYDGSKLLRSYPVSTAKNGAGNQSGSEKTPLGRHVILQKIGAGAPKGTVFMGQRNTGRIKQNLKNGGALMTSRLLRLRGVESRNRHTEKRLIYIHGTSAENLIGRPASHGCIRMINDHVIHLFDRVKVGTTVNLQL